MKCTQCQQDKSIYNFFNFRGKYNRTFFTRPIEEISGLCFDCAGPYRCLSCGAIQDASEFRLQGRYCHACKSPKPTSERRVNFDLTGQKVSECVEALETPENEGL